MRRSTKILLFFVAAGCILSAFGAERFPPPEFSTPHKIPSVQEPMPRGELLEFIDVAVLVGALSLASYLAIGRRSRRGLFVLTVFSLIYFGFYRVGCVCPIGAIQNVVLAIVDPGYAIPLTVVAFFTAPLLFTLFFGRTFCAAVCPLGAIQDLVVLRPVRVPPYLERALGLFAYVYLALAVLLTATGSAFLICRYDPFVGFFRLDAGFNMIVLGGSFLLIGVFVGRPYCRFICPYGALLGLLSRVSRSRITITPDRCIQCRLCEDACPFEAIQKPTEPARDRSAGKTRLALLLLLLPVLIALGGWLGSFLTTPLSRVHATVRLAERIHLEETGAVTETTDASDAFRTTGRSVKELYTDALAVKGQFDRGTWLLGGFVGLVAGLTLISLSIRRSRTDYEADRALCVACGRCFDYCPVGKVAKNNAKNNYPAKGCAHDRST